MSVAISHKHVKDLESRAHALKKRVDKIKHHAEEVTEKFVRTMEVGVAAFGAGVLQGHGGATVMGVPAELGGAFALNLLGYFGAAGKHSAHLNNLGDGLMAGYLVQKGQKLGTEWKAKGTLTSPTATKGARLSPQEIADIVNEAAGG